MHKVTVKDMDCEFKTRIAGAHSKHENKIIDMIVNPALDRKWYVVTDHKVKIMQGPSIIDAIDIYNKI